MADECIHGFDDGLCAICFPPPEFEPAPKAAPLPRSGRATGTRPRRPPARVPGASRPTLLADAPQIDAKALRIYHVTHFDNLAPILDAGALLADAAGAKPVVDVSAPDAREFRRTATIDGTDAVVADYVPFLLTTDAHVWNAVRTATPDPRLAEETTNRAPADFVILVSSVAGALGDAPELPGAIVVTDADAAAGGTLEASAWPETQRALQRLHRDDEGARLHTAELLVRECLPLDNVALIAVANDPVRDRVRSALAAAGLRTRVAVYPPWFQPTPDEAE